MGEKWVVFYLTFIEIHVISRKYFLCYPSKMGHYKAQSQALSCHKSISPFEIDSSVQICDSFSLKII
uniref:Uncharacterized protein n=1 Tax=Lepeophtheirus salmonis TaxID=72036 RepID=A0A0K2UE21_LEPSM